MTEVNRLNPLSKFQTYQIKHVVIGFRYSEDACTYEIGSDVGKCGSVVEGPACKGPGIVVINEMKDSSFVLYDATTYWDFFSETNATTGSYYGYMHVKDRAGMLFAQRLREYCERLGMALGHITFVWKTFFIGSTVGGYREVVTANPLVFHITDFTQSLSPELSRAYIFNFVASYNTFGQLPQFTKMYQTTLTHADGNVQKEVPTPGVADGRLQSRAKENQANATARKTRMDKSKPMKTIQDAFNAMQVEMTEQGYPNKRQVQEWQGVIRDDYTKKINPPQQYLPDLPIKYTIKLDSYYSSYKIDNRNLPFEQPEQDQRLEGIRAIPFQMGTNMSNAIDQIMSMSKLVARDYTADTPKGYRSTTTVLRGCGGQYNVTTNITPYTIPRNVTGGPDTGPGEGLIQGPLAYTYQDAKKEDRDVISINYHSNVSPVPKNLEQATEGENDSDIGVVYGNREPIGVQRMPREGTDFFTSGFSGNRSLIGVYDTNGLESSESATIIKTHQTPSMVKQTTSYRIKLVGNPYLLNDINRNPMDVAENTNTRWTYILYDKPESIPMYMKLTVYLRSTQNLSQPSDETLPQTYFYSGYLHIAKIVTNFKENTFIQTVEALRTEDSI